MPRLSRKRRSAPEDVDGPDVATPGPSRPTQRQRLSRSPSAASSRSESPESPSTQDTGNVDQLAKKLVRYALACEYSRTSVKRAEISSRVLPQGSRMFKAVFNEAQMQLQDTFGMHLVELPMREKATSTQKKASQRTEKSQMSSNSWIVCTQLPDKYRSVVTPSKIPTIEAESTYVGLTSFVVSLIYLSGGSITESRLQKHLRKCNADETTPLDRTEKVLQRMQKEAYIQEVKERVGDEITIEYIVGPRGKIEIGDTGVAGLVKSVYGELDERLAKQLMRTLKMSAPNDERPNTQTNGTSRRKGRGQQAQTNDEDENEDDSDEDDD